MFKKLPSTSYRALVLAMMVIIVLILLIAYDLWTGTIHGIRFGPGDHPTWAKDPISFSVFIALLIGIAVLGLIAWYYSLLEGIRYRRKKASNSGRK